MAMTREELKQAFQEAVSMEFADIPCEEDIDYTFSDNFVQKMDKLIARQKKPYWNFVNNGRMRVAMVAMVCLVLLTTVYGFSIKRPKTPEIKQAENSIESIRRYYIDGDGTTRIKKKYSLTALSESFELVQKSDFGDDWIKVSYQDAEGNYITFSQYAADDANFIIEDDTEREHTSTIGDAEVMIFEYPDEIVAIWLADGCGMDLRYYGCTDVEVVKEMIETMIFEKM